MNNSRSIGCAGLVLFLVGCGNASAAPAAMTPPTSTSADTALTRAAADKALASIPATGDDCRTIAVLAVPIAVSHLQDPKLQQTAGRAQLATFRGGDAAGTVTEGTAMATVVGKQPSGELLGNHHLLFAEGALRTENDVIALRPTENKCIFNANVEMKFHDGTGQLAGLSGVGKAEGRLDFCGGQGRMAIYGRLCKAAK